MNVVLILSDQHHRGVSGAYGDKIVRTPNIDALAACGTRFANAYTNCPICVPARASLATGQYVHQIGYWDNGTPYDGATPGWAHQLRECGIPTTAIGKLHYESSERDYGFIEQIAPMHVANRTGDLTTCLREYAPKRDKTITVREAGPGDSDYVRFDQAVGRLTCDWIRKQQGNPSPWVLQVGFVLPHPPYIVPRRYFDLYAGSSIPKAPQEDMADWPAHPGIAAMREQLGLSTQIESNALHQMRAAYYGAVTHLDDQIGNILMALRDCQLIDNTVVIYTSDHGDSLGARGLPACKFTMYDESVAVPLVVTGPGLCGSPKVVTTPVSLIDVAPTILQLMNVAEVTKTESRLRGESLLDVAARANGTRVVFSEYHTIGTNDAVFMITDGTYKLVYFVNGPPQLFHLKDDPHELKDLSLEPNSQHLLREYLALLKNAVDPDVVNRTAKASQRRRVESFGGQETIIRAGMIENTPAPSL